MVIGLLILKLLENLEPIVDSVETFFTDLFVGPTIDVREKDLDKSLGLHSSSINFDEATYVANVVTPWGFTLPLIFDRHQWKFIHEVAEIADVDPQQVIVDIARSRYFGDSA